MKTLLAQLPDDPSSVVISVKPAEADNAPLLPPTNGQRNAAHGPKYDPSMAYLLELSTILALRDEGTIAELGGGVAEALQNIMRNASSYHHVIVSRTIYYVLRLLQASYVSISTLILSII